MKVYKHASQIIQEITEQNKGFKTGYYDYYEKNKHTFGSQMNRIYSVSINTYKRYRDIKGAIEQVFSNENVRDYYLLVVLIHEGAIMNEKIKIGGKLSKMVKTHKEELQAILGITDQESKEDEVIYIRQNKHIEQELSLKEVKKQLNEEDFKVKKVGKLDLLRVHQTKSKTVVTHPFFKEHKFVIQDISSCMPVMYLNSFLQGKYREGKIKDFHGIDATSSPGNKSLQLSEIIGKLYSLEMDQKRYETLKRRVEQCQAKNIECLNYDFLNTNPESYEDVNVIICDPSCSGSGMKLHAQQNQECTSGLATPDEMKTRAQNLSKFQFKIVSHALTFPSVEYVVYSTCSLYEEENENVVRDILKKHKRTWKTVDLEKIDIGLSSRYLKGFHFNKNKKQGHSLRLCSTCGPKNYLNGFFLAIFERKSIAENEQE
eukprot:403340074